VSGQNGQLPISERYYDKRSTWIIFDNLDSVKYITVADGRSGSAGYTECTVDAAAIKKMIIPHSKEKI
jgi:hypothetical protein